MHLEFPTEPAVRLSACHLLSHPVKNVIATKLTTVSVISLIIPSIVNDLLLLGIEYLLRLFCCQAPRSVIPREDTSPSRHDSLVCSFAGSLIHLLDDLKSKMLLYLVKLTILNCEFCTAYILSGVSIPSKLRAFFITLCTALTSKTSWT